jgi:hypothetical protein
MKKQPLFLCLLGASLLFSITGYAQKTVEADTLEERVLALETQLEAMQSSLAGVAESAEADAGAIDAITNYLQLQSQASVIMASNLNKVKSMGFVAGINFPSREALLEGWHKQLIAQQKSVPGAPAPAPEEKRWDR